MPSEKTTQSTERFSVPCACIPKSNKHSNIQRGFLSTSHGRTLTSNFKEPRKARGSLNKKPSLCGERSRGHNMFPMDRNVFQLCFHQSLIITLITKPMAIVDFRFSVYCKLKLYMFLENRGTRLADNPPPHWQKRSGLEWDLDIGGHAGLFWRKP